MPYKLNPDRNVPMLGIYDQDGIIHNHWQSGNPGGVRDRGPVIPWLGEKQMHLVNLGLVVETTADAAVKQPAPAPSLEPVVEPAESVVEECIADMDHLGISDTAGAPACRTALRENGFKHGNDVIAASVKVRKQRAADSAL